MPIKLVSFDNELKKNLKDHPKEIKQFKKDYNLQEIALKVSNYKATNKLSSSNLAKKLHISLRDLTKVENGDDCSKSVLGKVEHFLSQVKVNK